MSQKGQTTIVFLVYKEGDDELAFNGRSAHTAMFWLGYIKTDDKAKIKEH